MRALLTVLIALIVAAPAQAAVEYTVTDLSAPGQPTLDAWGVNDDGVVVGQMNTGAPTSGFRWTPELGVRGLEGKNAIGRDVNAAGTAVGLYDRPQDIQFHTAARWDVFGTLSPLMPAFDEDCPAGDNSEDDCDGAYAHGISPDGVAVGASTIDGGAGSNLAPAYWLSSATQGIRVQDTPGFLEARNAAGVMVGQDGVRAAVWRAVGDKVLLPFLTDGQGQTGNAGTAWDVNDAGVVVGDGATRPGARYRAFSWTPEGGIRRLDTLGFGTSAFAISNRGEIVGTSKVTDNDAGARAVRWVDGAIADLNALIPPDSGWTLLEAHDVNNVGWIVGRGIKDGAQRAFLLRPAPALDVKLEGAGWDPFDDTFAIRATVTNIGTAPVTNLRLAQDLTPVTSVYPPDRRAIAVQLIGASPALPGTLAPGQKAEVLWLEQADAPGFLLYTLRISAESRGINQTYAGSVEVQVGEPGPLTLGDIAVLLMGQYHLVTDAMRAHMSKLRSGLSTYAAKSLKLYRGGKKTKVKPNPRELALARALGWEDNYFAPAPDNFGELYDYAATAVAATERAKYDALKEEFGGAKSTLIAAGVFLDRWTSADGVSELRATGSELVRMARAGELSGGLVSEAAGFWTESAVSPTARAETQRQLAGMTSDALTSMQTSYDNGLKTNKQRLKDFEETVSTDPKKAIDQLFYTKSKGETKLAIEYGKSLLGDKVFKSVGLLRRIGKSANGVDNVVEAVDDERRLAQMIDDGVPTTLTAAQAEAYTGMTKEMNQQLIDHAAAIQKRYPGIDLRVSVRPLGKGDLAKLKQGLTPKIEAIPIKKINEKDVHFLGADPKALNEVGYFTPKKPPAKVLKAMGKTERDELLARYETRLFEARAMAGKRIDDPVLAAKVGEMRKAFGKNGHTFEEKIQGRTIRTTKLKLGVEKQGNVSLLKNEGLTINGRSVGTRGKGFTSDLDTVSTMNGAQNLPAGNRGSVELSWQEALRSDPDLPFGFHGWRGFDLSATDPNHVKLVLSETLARMPIDRARAEARRLAAQLGCRPEDLLRTRRNGFIITVTSKGIIVEK